MTPYTVRHRFDQQLTEERGVTLLAALAAHPERFKGLEPKPAKVPESVWINLPIEEITKPEIMFPSRVNASSLVSESH